MVQQSRGMEATLSFKRPQLAGRFQGNNTPSALQPLDCGTLSVCGSVMINTNESPGSDTTGPRQLDVAAAILEVTAGGRTGRGVEPRTRQP